MVINVLYTVNRHGNPELPCKTFFSLQHSAKVGTAPYEHIFEVL